MQKYLTEARQLLALAIPVILAQIAQTAMGFVDTVMAGGYSATDMAAVAIGTSIWFPAILFGHGLLLALTPVVAQLNGSGRRDKVATQVRQGFWLAGIVSVLIMAVLWNAGYIIHAMKDIDPAMADKSVGYLHALLWGAPGYLFFQVVRNQCEGLAKTKPGMVMGFIGLLVNIPVNYLFIYGHFGFPELGGVGCGVATAMVFWVMFGCMLWWSHRARSLRDIYAVEISPGPDWKLIWRLVQLGLPIALALFFEVTLFAVVALLVAPLGIVNVAGHQIALNFSSLMFVLPMSLGAAVTIRVGFRLGKAPHPQLKFPHYPGCCLVFVWQLLPRCLPSVSGITLPRCITKTLLLWHWRHILCCWLQYTRSQIQYRLLAAGYCVVTKIPAPSSTLLLLPTGLLACRRATCWHSQILSLHRWGQQASGPGLSWG